jgi:hypothetical protein
MTHCFPKTRLKVSSDVNIFSKCVIFCCVHFIGLGVHLYQIELYYCETNHNCQYRTEHLDTLFALVFRELFIH